MQAALRHLIAAAGGRRTVAVLGEMAELGPAGAGPARRVGREAQRLGVDLVVAVGPLSRGYGGAWYADAGAAAGRAARPAAARRRGAREGQPVGGSRDGRGGAHVKLVLAAGVVAMLLGIVVRARLHRLPAPQRVRPEHPRGRARRGTSPSRARPRWAASAARRARCSRS